MGLAREVRNSVERASLIRQIIGERGGITAERPINLNSENMCK